MSKPAPAYTIIHSASGQHPETIETGLSSDEARRWLARKASECGQKLSQELVVKAPGGEVWSAVEAE